MTRPAGRTGVLTVAAVPIGDPADASAQLGPALAAASLIAAEDTRRVRRLATALGVDRLVVVGPGARPAHAGAALAPSWPGRSVTVADVDAATALLLDEVRPGDVVLVKASRAASLERVALAIAEDDADTAGGAGRADKGDTA